MKSLWQYGGPGWAFLVGVGSVVNIFPTVTNPSNTLTYVVGDNDPDTAALWYDWAQVGNDFNLAFHSVVDQEESERQAA